MGPASLPGLGAQTHFVPTDDKTEAGHSEGPASFKQDSSQGPGVPGGRTGPGGPPGSPGSSDAPRPPQGTYSHVGRDPPPLGPARSAGGSCRVPELCLSLDRSFGRTAQRGSRDRGGSDVPEPKGMRTQTMPASAQAGSLRGTGRWTRGGAAEPAGTTSLHSSWRLIWPCQHLPSTWNRPGRAAEQCGQQKEPGLQRGWRDGQGVDRITRACFSLRKWK